MERQQTTSPPADRHYLRLAECLIVFFLVPVLLYFFRHQLAHRVIPLVLVLAAVCAYYLLRSRNFDRRRLWSLQGLSRQLRSMILIGLLPALLLTLATYLFFPQHFLAFINRSPGLWLLVLLLYPLLAAYPQELIFRGFFFDRYRSLFPNQTAMIVGSALSFGLAHCLYGNWIAPVLSAAGGIIFGYRYLRSQSLVAAGLEHALWGNFLFFIGLGWFFYSGSIR
ncbi:MAG: CPBP family intramembrane glutamic endopeptidase [Thermodesulfobacteriota bacterium]